MLINLVRDPCRPGRREDAADYELGTRNHLSSRAVYVERCPRMEMSEADCWSPSQDASSRCR